ncbi:MAG TPA: MmcQ/YjbR family DNA-binding protein [Rectinemataceae bacterium]|nr:MmcQ/YjbR family DNA-binding protein [Rectinemataceae bacterium]
MDRPALLEILAAQPGTTSDMPFDDSALVFRVGGKIFAIVNVKEEPGSVSLKCEPEMAGDLRAAWKAIKPGWHLNKEHWNTIELDGTVPREVLADLVSRSWQLVASGLSRAARLKAGLDKAPRAGKGPSEPAKGPAEVEAPRPLRGRS